MDVSWRSELQACGCGCGFSAVVTIRPLLLLPGVLGSELAVAAFAAQLISALGAVSRGRFGEAHCR